MYRKDIATGIRSFGATRPPMPLGFDRRIGNAQPAKSPLVMSSKVPVTPQGGYRDEVETSPSQPTADSTLRTEPKNMPGPALFASSSRYLLKAPKSAFPPSQVLDAREKPVVRPGATTTIGASQSSALQNDRYALTRVWRVELRETGGRTRVCICLCKIAASQSSVHPHGVQIVH